MTNEIYILILVTIMVIAALSPVAAIDFIAARRNSMIFTVIAAVVAGVGVVL